MAEYRAALVDEGGVCQTVVIRDDQIAWEGPIPTWVEVALPADSPVSDGWAWDGAEWTPPPPPPARSRLYLGGDPEGLYVTIPGDDDRLIRRRSQLDAEQWGALVAAIGGPS